MTPVMHGRRRSRLFSGAGRDPGAGRSTLTYTLGSWRTAVRSSAGRPGTARMRSGRSCVRRAGGRVAEEVTLTGTRPPRRRRRGAAHQIERRIRAPGRRAGHRTAVAGTGAINPSDRAGVRPRAGHPNPDRSERRRPSVRGAAMGDLRPATSLVPLLPAHRRRPDPLGRLRRGVPQLKAAPTRRFGTVRTFRTLAGNFLPDFNSRDPLVTGGPA